MNDRSTFLPTTKVGSYTPPTCASDFLPLIQAMSMTSPGIRPHDDNKLRSLRDFCDRYYDPRECAPGAASTRFHIDYGIEAADKYAKLALEVYNEKEKTNFLLEKIGKRNFFVTDFGLTFWARDVQNNERHLFRAVVWNRRGSSKVELCEIKDGDEIEIPPDHSEHCRMAVMRKYTPPIKESWTKDDVRRFCVYLGELVGINLMGHSMLHALRDLCDAYFDTDVCEAGAGITCTHFDGIKEVDYFAELALEFYNDKEVNKLFNIFGDDDYLKHNEFVHVILGLLQQTNFYLEEIDKLNVFFAYYCFTFWAWTAENNKRLRFRGVVHVMCGDKVVLCETKNNDEITIPVHSKNCRLKCSWIDDYEANDATSNLVDASSRATVGHGDIDLSKLDGLPPMDDSELSTLRELCDKYFSPLVRYAGAGRTYFNFEGMEYVNVLAELALEKYNEKKRKNFCVQKVGKVNSYLSYYGLTFWARTAESEEQCVFRSVVDVLGGVAVLLCEIKAGKEIAIPNPVDYSDNCCLKRIRSLPPSMPSSARRLMRRHKLFMYSSFVCQMYGRDGDK